MNLQKIKVLTIGNIKSKKCVYFQQVEFTVDRNKTGNQSGWNPQKVEAEFLKLFKRASNDEIFGWIDVSLFVQDTRFKTST